LGRHVQNVSIGYRCPNCNDVNSINANRIYNGRLMFACSKCSICGIVPSMPEQDEAYLEFLSMYDDGHVEKVQDLESVIEQEKLVRPLSGIKELISKNDAVGNKLLEDILKSKRDYVVDFIVLEEPEPEIGHELKFLNID
jgi:DEAD/DEAH box helicase domain-containing protein